LAHDLRHAASAGAAQAVVYDAGRDAKEHHNMADFQETVMDAATPPGPVSTPAAGRSMAPGGPT
ncbi:hypothetical protein, partial [Stenotrophomonas sp. YIM B06876]|uniref:hypothetical protein n=1 Tax=Stenotrophomonas sp. YIM B06876 TaxID=3060211 RepID=UPI00273968DA